MAANEFGDTSTILDLACQFFECHPDQELYAAVLDASAAKLHEFLDRYRNFAATSPLTAPRLEPGTLRPYLRTDRTLHGGTGGPPWA
jgi:hypothetical protein